MRFNLKKTSLFVYILLLSQNLFASNSYESWTKVVLEKKLPYSIKLEFSQGIRLKDYISEVNQAFFEFSLSYKNSKGLRLNIPMRYSIYKDKIKHRVSAVTSYQYNFNPLSIKYILKYYRLYQNGEIIGEDEKILGDVLRNKALIKHKTDSFYNPFVSAELLFLLQSNNNLLEEPSKILVPLLAFDKNNYRLGYGGGFYDRTIAYLEKRKKITTIGIGFHDQKIDNLPRMKFDKKLDLVITENGVQN